MKKIFFILALFGCVQIAVANSLDINISDVTYSVPAEDVGVMNYTDGQTVTISDNIFNISELTSISVSDTDIKSGTVTVAYTGEKAHVTISGDLYGYVSAEVSGAHVTINQDSKVGDSTTGEITYQLAGESNNGSFVLNGSYKVTIELTGLSLENPNGAAIDIQNGKRIELSSKNGTVNTLADGTTGSQKAALYCKGHLELKGKGVLNVTGNKGHAISAKEYVELKNCTVNILGAVKDGINCTQYFLMESGELNISGTSDDGIQTDFKDSENREDEDTGTITINGGKLNISVTNDASKALKAEGNFVITDGELTASTSGNGIWDADKMKTKASSCIGADGDIHIDGGILVLTSTGGGGKGIRCDGTYYSTSGNITIKTTGGLVAYVNGTLNQNYTGNADNIKSDYKSSPKGIKADTEAILSGGVYTITTTGHNGEGIESKGDLTFAGDVTMTIRAYDDGTNSSKNTYIKGGILDIISTGNGDGIDSNANIYISGGRITSIGAGGAEQGLDAGDNYKTYFTGGEILAYGGNRSSVPNSVDSTQAYLTVSATPAAGNEVTVSLNGEVVGSFTIPNDYTGLAGGGWPRGIIQKAPGGGPGGMGGNENLLISLPQLVSGTTYSVTVGQTTTTATAKK